MSESALAGFIMPLVVLAVTLIAAFYILADHSLLVRHHENLNSLLFI
ncbi:MAG: hypothetical protein QM405_00350 [Euryarchaeota archaeon]|nr:hypothetical protein [Euryarchaeota archaeon]